MVALSACGDYSARAAAAITADTRSGPVPKGSLNSIQNGTTNATYAPAPIFVPPRLAAAADAPSGLRPIRGGDSTAPFTLSSENGAVIAPLSGYLSVNDVLNEALLRSPRAAAVRLMLDIQKSLYWQATVMPNPSFFRDEAPISEGVRRTGAIRTWDPPWKIAFRLLAAKRQVREQKLELMQSLWIFRNDVRRAYTEVVIAQETYDTLSQVAALANRLLDVSQKLFNAGSVAELDVLKARLAAAQTDVERDQGSLRVKIARQQLNIIIGRNGDTSVEVPRLPQFKARAERTGLLPDLTKELPPLSDFVTQAYSNRLELRTLSAQIAVAEAQLLNAYGNVIPDPSINVGRSSETNPPTGPKLDSFFFTFNVEIPVFGLSQGDISRLRATIRQYRAQIMAQRNQIVGDVSAAYNHLVSARRKIAVYQEHILSDSEKVARLARRSYEVGQSDITSTLAAQQANVTTQSQYLDAVNKYQQAYIELEQSIGMPLQ